MYRGERLNAATHLMGLLVAVPATAWLVMQAWRTGDMRRAIAAAAFGLALVTVFVASTMCHSTRGHTQTRWARADHGAIFLLIAGTATPFTMLIGSGWTRWPLLAAVWSVALFGAMRSLFGRSSRPMLWLYLTTGWLATTACLPALLSVPSHVLGLFLAGALVYTAGTFFFANPARIRHAHGFWHLFVVAGSGLHFGAVLQCVAP